MKQLRFITAASLFDGHDVSINIMRRLLQSKGAEVIHLGHNRSAREVVDACIQEDAHAVALSSYQGGHMEYFSYIRAMLNDAGASHVHIFGGGGGVISPPEREELHSRGVTQIYSPEDGMKMGLVGIIDDMLERANYSTIDSIDYPSLGNKKLSIREISKVITYIEDCRELPFEISELPIPVLGITGTGGAGKSTLIDELLLRLNRYCSDKKVALISVDPTKKKTQGALLGDRIRLGSASYDQFYIRSLATRNSHTELSPQIINVVGFLRSQDFDLIIVETSGIGQASDAITEVADHYVYVMTPEYGAASQLEKIEMLEVADFIVLNKFEKPRSEDALRDIRKQYRRNSGLFTGHPGSPTDDELPVYGTMASQFNDVGVNALFRDICKTVGFSKEIIERLPCDKANTNRSSILSSDQVLYLREISRTCRDYNAETERLQSLFVKYNALETCLSLLSDKVGIASALALVRAEIGKTPFKQIDVFRQTVQQYESGIFPFKTGKNEIEVKTKFQSLSLNAISKVASPRFSSDADIIRFVRNQNLPGHFPFAAGLFPFKRADEDPKRMFAGVGGPKRTNKRFHYLSGNDPFKRLSTAFDSATLYGEDPDERPDIFGKIGEAGVSIATLDDMEALFDGFDLANPRTSVSMTVNGPAPMMLAMYMNTAIKSHLADEDFWNEEKRIAVMRLVRGTVQSDILKEDQAQNTCIFSLEFAIKMMGDIQEYFSKHQINNYYTASISGYHIAEAGANPITQLAFTLANGFTYIEYFLNRGLKIDDFCHNLSFFFSNGLDPEYTVMGRVARKIWAITLRDKYGANIKSQKFKYHIQTSGRSLHAQEIDFNDIRTTLQAFLALSDNCNSLHTNAYDEAVTTPTEESVRRAMAIQMIINSEYGISQTDNPLQGSYLIEELADIVEERVLAEFEVISDKGGVLGAMESMYQRSKIQEESLYYETLKDTGSIPLIGVNTFIADNISEQMNQEVELSRCTDEEKQDQIDRLNRFKARHADQSSESLNKLKEVALSGGNIFQELLTTVNYCSLGQITSVLFEVGGKYRRNM